MSDPETAHEHAADDTTADPAPEAPEVAADAADADQDTDDGDDQGVSRDPLAKARRQAAAYRERLRNAETERDGLREALAAHRRATVDWHAERAGVDPALLDAAGIDRAALLDDTGMVDQAALDEAISATKTRFDIRPRMKSNPAQGAVTGETPRAPSLADAFRRPR